VYIDAECGCLLKVKDPILLHAPTRKSATCFGVVSLSRGKFVCSMCKKFDVLTFGAFLKKLWRHCLRRASMVIVLGQCRMM
jgi:hypothetical protein